MATYFKKSNKIFRTASQFQFELLHFNSEAYLVLTVWFDLWIVCVHLMLLFFDWGLFRWCFVAAACNDHLHHHHVPPKSPQSSGERFWSNLRSWTWTAVHTNILLYTVLLFLQWVIWIVQTTAFSFRWGYNSACNMHDLDVQGYGKLRLSIIVASVEAWENMADRTLIKTKTE